MSNIVRYNSPTNRGPSVALWGNMSKIVADSQMGKCGYVFEDFMGAIINITNSAAANTVGPSGWLATCDANIVVHQVATVDLSVGQLGALHIDGMETDNDECAVHLNPVTGGSFKFDSTYPQSKILFECRVKKETVGNTLAMFAGLARYDLWTAGLLVDDTTAMIATGDFVGFHIADAAGATVLAKYGDNGQAHVTVNATAKTMVADTWTKFGFIYDLTNTSKALRFFVDGVEIASDSAAYVTAAALSTTGFPDDAVCNPGVAFKLDGTTTSDAYIDWIAACQYIDPLD